SGMATNAEDRTIAASVISLGRALGLQVVAEGVESVDQLEWLSELDCDLAQGFNWLAPDDAATLERRPGSQATRPPPPSSAPKSAGDVRVLLADDRDSTRAMLRTALEIEDGFVVVGD